MPKILDVLGFIQGEAVPYFTAMGGRHRRRVRGNRVGTAGRWCRGI